MRNRLTFGFEFFFYLLLVGLVKVLPWRGLYGVAFLLGKCIQLLGYRKKVIENNLQLAFPHYNKKEKKRIISSFYQYFSKVLLESLKGYVCNQKKLKGRYILKNPEVIRQELDQGKSVLMLMAHFNNWEWNSAVLPAYFRVPIFAIYKPLRNTFINQWIHRSREKKGMKLYSLEEVGLMVRKALQQPSIMIFLSDQRPARTEYHHAIWVSFFNINTPFPQGAQAIAEKFNLPVFYARVKELKKGNYLCEFVPIQLYPMHGQNIMASYVSMLEQDIKTYPASYMWSHNRWKYINFSI